MSATARMNADLRRREEAEKRVRVARRVVTGLLATVVAVLALVYCGLAPGVSRYLPKLVHSQWGQGGVAPAGLVRGEIDGPQDRELLREACQAPLLWRAVSSDPIKAEVVTQDPTMRVSATIDCRTLQLWQQPMG